MSLPPNVVAGLDVSFAAEDQAAAQELLPSTDELVGAPYAHVLFAIIALSEGKLSALAHYAERARQDWRDVIYWHEHPRSEDEPSSYRALRARIGLPPDPDHLD
jgi:hypothetical protein